MIGALPILRRGELVYSGLARRTWRLGYHDGRASIDEVFGRGTATAIVDLPNHLAAVAAALPPGHGYTPDLLMDKHTLLPYYTWMQPRERSAQLRRDMRGCGSSIHMRAGITASGIPQPRWLRLCPLCVEEDRRGGEEAYWHCVHQAPGVDVCAVHYVPLVDTDVPMWQRSNRLTFVAAEDVIGNSPPPPCPVDHMDHDAIHAIAADAAWLLAHPRLIVSGGDLQARYLGALADRDVVTVGGRVRVRDLVELFGQHYTEGYLAHIGCPIDREVVDNWVVRLVRKPDGAQHPLRHLLLIHALGHSIASFLARPTAITPFGEAPYPCLNKASDHYGQPRIERCVVSRGTDGCPVGTFACPCGFTYKRSGPDTTPEDRLRRGRVATFGPIWEEALRVGWVDMDSSLERLSHQLGVDPATVTLQAARLSLPQRRVRMLKGGDRRPYERITSTPASERDIKVEHRDQWIQVVNRSRGAGVTAIRSAIPATYMWLYRHDRAWLGTHTPPHQDARRDAFVRVDWHQRDTMIAQSLRQAATRLRNTPGRPIWLTRTAIARHSGYLASLEKHSDKLPETCVLLQLLVETREEFALRRVWWAVAFLRRKREQPEYWDLIERSGTARVKGQPRVAATLQVGLSTWRATTDSNQQAHGLKTALPILLRYTRCRQAQYNHAI